MMLRLQSTDVELQLAIAERDIPLSSSAITLTLAPCRIIALATSSLPLSIAAQSKVLPHVSRFPEIWSCVLF